MLFMMTQALRNDIVEFSKQHPLFSSDKKVVIGKGKFPCEILIVGEAPENDENIQGIPFVGKAGQLLDTWLEKTNIQDKVGITNSVFLIPLDSSGKIRKLTPEEIADFKPYVQRIIKETSPKMIICLGSSATECILNKSVSRCIGIDHEYDGILVRATYHPAYFLRGHSDGVEMFKRLFEKKPEHKNLVFDIEATDKDPLIALPRFFGAYSYPENKYYTVASPEETQEIINRHNTFVGYNILEYDNKVLRRNKITFPSDAVFIDLYLGVKNFGRRKVMGLEGLLNNQLGTVVKFLKLGKKKDLDYNLLKKPKFTVKERHQIEEYLRNDVEITRKLFEWWMEWSKPFEEFVSEYDKRNMTYLTCSIPSYAYKVIAQMAGIREEYNDHAAPRDKFEGAFVCSDVEEARENIVSFDFVSEYPHAEIMGNLHAPVDDSYTGKVFKANEFFPELQGTYKADEMCPIDKALWSMFKLRKSYKKRKDKREQALKIAINSTYGASTNMRFKNLYNPWIGPDTTYIGRTCVKYCRKCFQEAGFRLIYSDTDSIYLQIPKGRTLDEVLAVKDAAMIEIRKWLPFPVDTFELKLENKIKYFQTFSDEGGDLKKKYYIYVTEEDRLIVKGLPVIKSDCTKVSSLIFRDLEPTIIKKLDCKFKKDEIQQMVLKYAQENVGNMVKMYKVRHPHEYKVSTQLQAQIATKYGRGEHFLIKNKRYGAGIGVKYCTVEEAEKLNLQPRDLDFSGVLKELNYFIKQDTIQTKLTID